MKFDVVESTLLTQQFVKSMQFIEAYFCNRMPFVLSAHISAGLVLSC